jgi:hypothetical protein
MLLAILAASISVGLGIALALVPHMGIGSSAIGRVRTFALVAAITVVALHLFPEAVRALGTKAIAVFLLGIVLPAWAERGLARIFGGADHGHHDAHAHAHGSGRLALEIGFLGLVLHHLGDGIALYTYATTPDVVLTLAAHTVPLIAVVVLQYSTPGGRSRGIVRAALLLVAMIVGALGARIVPPDLVADASPWIAAVVSGLLLHVIAHDIESDPPRTTGSRLFDLFVAILGVAIPIYGGSEIDDSVIAGFMSRLQLSAPALLLGLLAAAILVPRIARLASSSRLAFVESALSMDALFLAIRFLGVAFALAHFVLANVAALTGGIVIGRRESGAPSTEEAYGRRFLRLFRRVGPWMIAACFLAADLDHLVPRAELAQLVAPSLGLFIATLFAFAVAIAPAAAMPIAQVLLHQHASLGATLALAIIGSMVGLGGIEALGRHGSPKRAWAAAIAMIAVVWISASIIDAVGIHLDVPVLEPVSPVEVASSAILGLVFLSAIWEDGVRNFIAGLKQPLR